MLAMVVAVVVTVGGGDVGPCRSKKLGGGRGRYGKEAGLVGAVVAAVVLAAVAAVVVLTAAAVVSAAVAEDQCQPLVGSFLGSGGDDGSLQAH